MSCCTASMEEFCTIAGSSEPLLFEIYAMDTNEKVNVSQSTAVWTLTSYTNRGVPILKKDAVIYEDPDEEFPYRFRVILDAGDTFNFSGKYFQQLDVRDELSGRSAIFQGFITIRKNMDSTAMF